jgi:3-dehydroquinate synthase
MDVSHINLDQPLSIGVMHRLRFTSDAFNPANRTLRDVFAAGGEREPRRTIALIDSGVGKATPDLAERISAYADAHADAMRLVHPPEVVPGGEAAKNSLNLFHHVLDLTHEHHLCRRSVVLAIGGGAMLDAVGFAAATAHRGVRLVRMPTTTLAQDDAGVGVKNGVNYFGKKNFLGAFAAPWAVVNDDRFLQTLADRDYRAGFSECVKVALVKDPAFFDRIEAAALEIAERRPEAANPVIAHSAILHLNHIARGGDPFELSEARPLDFGHWSAHRLEALTNFELRHGEAVAIGIMLDATYSHLVGWLDRASLNRIERCLRALGFELSHPALRDPEPLLNGLEEFREHLGGRLTIALLRGIGMMQDVHEIDRTLMERSIEHVRGLD